MGIKLLNTTGYAHVDEILRGVIGLFEMDFPGRIISYYVIGSYADRTAVPYSDLDLVVVFDGVADHNERATWHQMTGHLTKVSPVLLDCLIHNAETLTTEARAEIMSALPIYGVDERGDYALETLDRHIARAIRRAAGLMRTLRGDRTDLTTPLDFPAESEWFYGYDRYGIPISATEFASGLRNMTTLATTIAMALIAIFTGERAASKAQAVSLYRRVINDEWTTFVSDAYHTINLRWRYQVPTDKGQRQRLHAICQWMLAFENHFLDVVHEKLLAYLTHESDTVRYYALLALNDITYLDNDATDIIMALDAEDAHGDLVQQLQRKLARQR